MSLTPLPRFLLNSRSRIRIVWMAVLGVLPWGTITFDLLEGWSILDGLYVTVPVPGRVFATGLMTAGGHWAL